MTRERAYIAIDMKSYYASVECVWRDLDPLKANLIVADESRSDQTICLAVSPALKAKGVSPRPRLFEAKQAVRLWEAKTGQRLSWLIACPRMQEYERISARIYSILLRYASGEDIHIYSIDESFIDCTGYLHLYESEARAQGVCPARLMAMTVVRDILTQTGITATVGIGTNLYLAKIAMDIVAKRMPPDKDGVRVAELDEESFRYLLWDHMPLTDFWMIGRGTAARLMKSGLFTMGDIARRSQDDEEWFYKTFGVNGEIIVDHAWGREPVTMPDIKNYRTDSHSLSTGQVLPRPYGFDEALNCFLEMSDSLCGEMFRQKIVSRVFTWFVGYDPKSLEFHPDYKGPLALDFYGRLHPKHGHGTVRLPAETDTPAEIREALRADFLRKADPALLFRRLGICACDTVPADSFIQTDLFSDYEAREKARSLQFALLEIRTKYGMNSLFTGNNLLEGATMLDRNRQIGGHRA